MLLFHIVQSAGKVIIIRAKLFHVFILLRQKKKGGGGLLFHVQSAANTGGHVTGSLQARLATRVTRQCRLHGTESGKH